MLKLRPIRRPGPRTIEVGLEELAHGYRVGALAYLLSRRCGFREADIRSIYTAAVYHDIGKCTVPRAIVHKPGKLTDPESRKMRKHVEASRDLCRSMGIESRTLDVIYAHHESFDGTGYPVGLRASDIPVGSRILRICDVYDALTSFRVYRPAFPRDKALAIMEDEKNAFDPEIYKVFMEEAIYEIE